jgi:hypothetical protein
MGRVTAKSRSVGCEAWEAAVGLGGYSMTARLRFLSNLASTILLANFYDVHGSERLGP